MTELERRLKLTRFLREENAMNRVKMKSREEILYGSGKPISSEELPSVYEGYLNDTGYDRYAARGYAARGERSSFGTRMALALILFGLVIYLDKNGTALAGQPIGEFLSQQISVSMEDRLTAFLQTESRTDDIGR